MAVLESATLPFTLITLPSKGIGLLATARIPAHTLLFREAPLLLLPLESHSTPLATRVLRAFSLLPSASKATLLSLCSNLPADEEHRDETTALAVWKANNFCLDDAGTVNGVFALGARLNHACVGGENCRWVWDLQEGVMAFWTERDIEVEEELTHCYRPDWRMGTKNRRAALMEEYGFWCGCKTCEEPEEDN